MKKLLFALLLVFPALIATAQTKAVWPEKDAFSDVMSKTFHPAEEGKLDPIKQRIGEMVTKAKAWQKSTPPAEMNKPEIKTALGNLVKETKGLQKSIKKGASDADITKELTALHDVFHGIVGLCNDAH
jgi:hypothetical protein